MDEPEFKVITSTILRVSKEKLPKSQMTCKAWLLYTSIRKLTSNNSLPSNAWRYSVCHFYWLPPRQGTAEFGNLQVSLLANTAARPCMSFDSLGVLRLFEFLRCCPENLVPCLLWRSLDQKVIEPKTQNWILLCAKWKGEMQRTFFGLKTWLLISCLIVK